ncbi:hypothetical protein D5S17_09325 [Pseudonocardiaceae bacterium YIM PH 21723]|nr:hypothetical protein D5S17_09325 [Pseudonocardiaceae bacterium YIM PH 21723]
MSDRQDRPLVKYGFDPKTGEGVALFESMSSPDYWIVLTYPDQVSPDLYEYGSLAEAELEYTAVLAYWANAQR